MIVSDCGGDDIRFLLGACGHGTSLGVISPGMLPILVIGLLDCVGGPQGCSDWLVLMSRWVWLCSHRMIVLGAVVVCPGVVRIEYKRRTLTGSSSLDAAPVTHLSSTLLCDALPIVVPLKSLCGCCSAVLTVSGLLCVDYIYGEFVAMATDSAAATGGIVFDVELVVPWDAPETVVDLHSDGVIGGGYGPGRPRPDWPAAGSRCGSGPTRTRCAECASLSSGSAGAAGAYAVLAGGC